VLAAVPIAGEGDAGSDCESTLGAGLAAERERERLEDLKMSLKKSLFLGFPDMVLKAKMKEGRRLMATPFY
jgi:hypothetical protein